MPERNAKVRRRIAAGKFRLRIRDLRNLGPRAEQQLAEVGIHSTDALRRRGALEAYLAVKRAAEGRGSLNLLWALAGALEPWPEGRDWREVAVGELRLPLLLALEAREGARRATLEAAGVAPVAGKTRRKVATRRTPTPDPWVPGLPFEGSGQPAAKRGRRGGRPGRGGPDRPA